MVQFIASAVIVDRVIILQFIMSSICWVNMLCSPVKITSIASWIASFSRPFMVLNKVAWSSLGECSVLSVMISSGVGLAASLVLNLPLIWESILVIRVVWLVGGPMGVSKICLSGVMALSKGGWVLGRWSAMRGAKGSH